MPNPSNVIRKTAENVIHLGAPPTFSKSVYIEELRKRADEIRTDGESDAQAFVRTITSDPVGTVLYKASKFAEGPDHEPEKPMEREKPKVLGPAHARMEMLAQDHHKANPHKSKEGAYAAVYASPGNADLREQCKQEHLDSLMRRASPAADVNEDGVVKFVKGFGSHVHVRDNGPGVIPTRGGYYKRYVDPANGEVSYLFQSA